MQRPTFAQLRSSEFPKAIGVCPTDFSDIAAGANLCIEKLIIDPMAPDEGWWGGWARFAFNVQPINPPNGYAYFTTARNVARVIGIDVCSTPIKMRNGFDEFLEFSQGLQPRSSQCGNGTFLSQNCACAVNTASFDRDNVVTRVDFPGTPQRIRLFPTNDADLGRRVLLQGPDQNNMTVLGVDPATGKRMLGEFVGLAKQFVDSVNLYTSLTGLNKQSTLGPVQVFAVDPITGTQTQLTTMDPDETTASYRRYLLTGLPRNCCNSPAGTVTITAQAKLDFVPVQTDTDYLSVPNIPALVEEGYALRYSRHDSDLSAKLELKHHTKALALLNGQLDHFTGKVNTAVRVPIFGSDRMRLQPR